MSESFDVFNKWAVTHLAMELDAYKEKQLQRRILNMMSNHPVNDLTGYMRLMEKDQQIKGELKNYLTINVTEFFRNPELFDALNDQVTKTLQPKFGSLKCWSAACSNGSEPYSLAMMLTDKKIKTTNRILATDIDKKVLTKAKQGLYLTSELKNVSTNHLNSYFDQNEEGYLVTDDIKRKVRFKEHDLLQHSFESEFHLIICRNVTIYFKPDARDRLYQKFYDALVPGGIFFTGATETINQPEQFGFKKIDSFIYQK
ncbi:CheR family methyltransferase [Vagococcus sp.]|uniref:CheR family methyltransferase n=1 Tax=Vagococcus sp. TaxID=1933889 RepID=UPI002FC83C36